VIICEIIAHLLVTVQNKLKRDIILWTSEHSHTSCEPSERQENKIRSL